MPHVTLTEAPLRLDRPSFVLDYDAAVGAAGIQLNCWMRNIEPSVDQDDLDIETFCNPGGQQPGKTTRGWDIELFMTPELHGLLSPLESKLVTFATLRDHGATVDASNPEFSGQLWVPALPDPIQGGVGSIDPVTLTFPEYGDRVKATTDVAKATTHPT